MAKRTIWTCDICGDTVPNKGLIYQIPFVRCKVEDEFLEVVREEDCYQICNKCIKNAHTIFTDYCKHNKKKSGR